MFATVLQPLFGVAILVLLALVTAETPRWSGLHRQVPWRLLLISLALQLVIAALLLNAPGARDVLLALNGMVHSIETATTTGASFVFGYLAGGDTPFVQSRPESANIFAFRVLPQVLVFSVLVALFWHWRILPAVVQLCAWALKRLLGVGGAVSVAAASSIFLGMIEAPLVVRAWLGNMTRSELFILMTCGMSTVAGSIMILYATVLNGVLDNALGHIVVASVMSVPAAILFAIIMVPPGPASTDTDQAEQLSYASTMDAITRGTTDGLNLVFNIAAMLVVLVSLVALVNGVLSLLPLQSDLTLQQMLGVAFAPLAWLMGIPAAECSVAGSLLGVKFILNELVAFLQLAELSNAAATTGGVSEIASQAIVLSERSRLILVYGLCGFANFGSLGIMLGGLQVLCPERRSDILTLAPRSLLSGTYASTMTGCIVAMITF